MPRDRGHEDVRDTRDYRDYRERDVARERRYYSEVPDKKPASFADKVTDNAVGILAGIGALVVVGWFAMKFLGIKFSRVVPIIEGQEGEDLHVHRRRDDQVMAKLVEMLQAQNDIAVKQSAEALKILGEVSGTQRQMAMAMETQIEITGRMERELHDVNERTKKLA